MNGEQTQAIEPLADALVAEPVMLFLGILCHFLKVLVQSRKEGVQVGFISYWKDHRYETALSIIASLVFYAALYEANQLNMAAAFGAGYLGDNAADLLGKRAGGKV